MMNVDISIHLWFLGFLSCLVFYILWANELIENGKFNKRYLFLCFISALFPIVGLILKFLWTKT